MNRENKERVRAEIAKSKEWVVIDGILGEEISPSAWGEKCAIIYQDMDCQPCMCTASCEHIPFGGTFFKAIDGDAAGNRMSAVIAYRIIKEVKP